MKYTAELIGTFFLVLTIGCTVQGRDLLLQDRRDLCV